MRIFFGKYKNPKTKKCLENIRPFCIFIFFCFLGQLQADKIFLGFVYLGFSRTNFMIFFFFHEKYFFGLLIECIKYLLLNLYTYVYTYICLFNSIKSFYIKYEFVFFFFEKSN